MTDYSVHAELLSSSYESPGSRCSGLGEDTSLRRASVVLGCCGCRSQLESASGALASYQTHAIISEMTLNRSWQFVSHVLADRRMEIIEVGGAAFRKNHWGCRQRQESAAATNVSILQCGTFTRTLDISLKKDSINRRKTFIYD